MAKLKKGSKEAKAFMAKLRAARSGKKKKPAAKKVFKTRAAAVKHINKKRVKKGLKKISGEKHQDVKSHNYKINISGLKENNLKEYFKLIEDIKRGQMYIDAIKYDIKRFGKGKGSNYTHRSADLKYYRQWVIEQKKKLAILKRLIKNTL